MAGKNNNMLKRDIAGAMYDLLVLKGHNPADANSIVKGTIGQPEHITEHSLLRFLIRLQEAHTNRGLRLPPHWAERLRELKRMYPAKVRRIREEVKLASRLDRSARTRKQPRRTKPR